MYDTMIGFIKYNRSDASLNLENRPNENHLLNVIARRTSRNGNPVKGVKVGESLLGDYENLGLKRQPYRTALANLIKWGYITTRVTNKTTYAKLANIEVYDCNINGVNHAPNHDPNQQATNNQPTANQELTTIKKERKKEEKKVKKKEEKEIPFINEVREILLFFVGATGKSLRIDEKDWKLSRSDKYRQIIPRLKEGATVEECKRIITLKTKQWKGDKVMDSSLCIETIFRPTKFSKYLDEIDNVVVPLTTANYTPPYHIPTFATAEQRQKYFHARLNEYHHLGLLDEGLYNTKYKVRARTDGESLCYELEQADPQLAKVELNYIIR